MELKCLTVRNPWASLIVSGQKTIELRSWSTTHRGPLGIHVGQSTDWCTTPPPTPLFAFAPGFVAGVVQLIDVRAATPADADAACVAPIAGLFAWVLGRRVLHPWEHSLLGEKRRGRLGLWSITTSLDYGFAT